MISGACKTVLDSHHTRVPLGRGEEFGSLEIGWIHGFENLSESGFVNITPSPITTISSTKTNEIAGALEYGGW